MISCTCSSVSLFPLSRLNGHISSLRTRTPQEVFSLLPNIPQTEQWTFEAGKEMMLPPSGYLHQILGVRINVTRHSPVNGVVSQPLRLSRHALNVKISSSKQNHLHGYTIACQYHKSRNKCSFTRAWSALELYYSVTLPRLLNILWSHGMCSKMRPHASRLPRRSAPVLRTGNGESGGLETDLQGRSRLGH